MERNIPIPVSKEENYSRDRNIWHLSHEGSELEDPANEPLYDRLLQLSVTLKRHQIKPTYVEIEFERGIPVKVDGKALSLLNCLSTSIKSEEKTVSVQ